MIVIVGRAPRERMIHVTCFCRRRRKDGTCLFNEAVLPLIREEFRQRVRLEHPGIDGVLHRMPSRGEAEDSPGLKEAREESSA